MNDIYISRMMTKASVAMDKAMKEIIHLRAENEKLQLLLDFALAKSGDVHAEQSA